MTPITPAAARLPLFRLRAARALTLAALALALGCTAGRAHGVDVSAGDLFIHAAFTRATPAGAPVAGGFLTIENRGQTDDRLTGGTATFAREVQVHEMAMEGDVMKMRALPDGLPIPAGQTVELKPGSYHLMFIGLNQALEQGGSVDVILTFEKTGAVTVPMVINAPGAKSMH